MRFVPNFLLRAIFTANGQLRNIVPADRRVFDQVEILPFKDGARAAASISADFELAWAWRNLSAEGMEARAATERENVPRLIAMLEKHRIPITWATVGHLFLESCTRGRDGRPHSDMPRPGTNFGWEGDWYRHDPCTNVSAAPGWFCPDLIRLIQRSTVAHEIGTHSFSHIDFGPDRSNAEQVRREIDASIDAMRSFGVHPRSLVYCFNHMGHQHLPLLASLGLTSVRHRDRIRLAYPERTAAGVYKIYESANLRVSNHYDYAAKADLFLREAQRHQAAFHVWFHPSDTWAVFEQVFDRILGLMAAYRDCGGVWVATMHDLVSYCEARATTDLTVSRAADSTRIVLRTTIDSSRFGAPEITIAIPVAWTPARIMVTQNGQTTARNAGKPIPGRPGQMQFNVSCRAQSVEIFH